MVDNTPIDAKASRRVATDVITTVTKARERENDDR
jgi:hypothetical protein